ncbi:hypothetical protein SAMN05444407_10524 [Chryseobacterium contaminans]|uniref:Uncharacterized protein n=1 Tax=Chryseobacterium contaminans TaxID=1423959 RepID=A0A1M7BYT9_9FLAO|nr:hypothetical protein SAMN05444407_10524 [Chryseobacterium contaminans]
MDFDWIYLIVFLFFIFIIGVFVGIAYLIMRFCNRWTKDHKYKKLLNTLIFIGSFFLASFLSLYIFFTNVYLGR